jgi:hypothetical protein
LKSDLAIWEERKNVTLENKCGFITFIWDRINALASIWTAACFEVKHCIAYLDISNKNFFRHHTLPDVGYNILIGVFGPHSIIN